MCLDNSDLTFSGTQISPSTSYLTVELLACERETLQQTPGYENAECASELEVKIFMKTHIVAGYMSNTFVNKTMFDGNPVNTLNDIVFADMLTYGDQV